jgi:lipoate---protein ligase
MTEIIKPSDDPWFNLAAEEFVVKHIQDEVFMLWKNTNCIVVGKHQNTVAEVNMKFITENEIPVIRRISGGGTVFQGFGNH